MLPHLRCGREHGPHDPIVRSAPAEIAVQRGAHVLLGGVLVSGEQCSRGDHDPGDAVPALGRLLVDDRPGDRVWSFRRAKTLDGGHRPSRDGPHRGITRIRGFAVDEHEAGSTQAETATETTALEAEMIAKHVQQGGLRFGSDPFAATVDHHGQW
jgi:hypothetical protein